MKDGAVAEGDSHIVPLPDAEAPALDDLTEPLVPGRAYRVRCVRIKRNGGELVPVWGAWHEDADLKVAMEHLHLAVPFVPMAMIGSLLSSRAWFHDATLPELATLLVVAREKLVDRDAPEEVHVLECLRPQPEVPARIVRGLSAVRRGLRSHGADRLARPDCARCPHRGGNLAVAPPRADGSRRCPLHGLLWDQHGALLDDDPSLTEEDAA